MTLTQAIARAEHARALRGITMTPEASRRFFSAPAERTQSVAATKVAIPESKF